jgi:hypothetical protein
MISFEDTKYHMFNFIICEFLVYNDVKLFGKNYIHSYYKPNIGLMSSLKHLKSYYNPDGIYSMHDNYNIIIIISKNLNLNLLKKWKLGINEFSFTYNYDYKYTLDFSNLCIKKFYIVSKNIIKFPENAEEIIYINDNFLNILNFKHLKYYLVSCCCDTYNKCYSNLFFNKLIVDEYRLGYDNNFIYDVTFDLHTITFSEYDMITKINYDYIKYITL